MSSIDPDNAALHRAAEWIQEADGLLIAAGAGMGVDSGLPDFRGTEGFWRAYPALARAQLRFDEIACPTTFLSDPRLAWGFYGHRLSLYRQAVPHAGFRILTRWARRKRFGAFVLTSNVDGQFQKAGFGHEEVAEIHGSIHILQCIEPCCESLWPATGFEPRIDEENCRLLSSLPTCPRCGSVARPNIMMFDDPGWIASRSDAQTARLRAWLASCANIVAIELGAGTSIPTVRMFAERYGRRHVRINVRESQVRGERSVGLKGGALACLTELDALTGG